MKKALLSLVAATFLSTTLNPCGQSDNIRKAFRIVECILRQSQREVVAPFEIEHALELYFKELSGACGDCNAWAHMEYGFCINKLQRLLEACNR